MSFRIRIFGLLVLTLSSISASAAINTGTKPARKTADICWMGYDRETDMKPVYYASNEGPQFDKTISKNMETTDGLLIMEFQRNVRVVTAEKVLDKSFPRQMVVTVSGALNGQLIKKSITILTLPRGGHITLFDSAQRPIYIQCGTYADEQ